ncbi:hypothetical protein PGB90_009066 [Kerria lacca]
MAENWETNALERQRNHQRHFLMWKEFDTNNDGLLKTSIGYVLFGLADVNDLSVPLLRYHEYYNTNQKETINTVFNQIINLVPDSNRVSISHTILSVKADEEYEHVIIRCRSRNNNVYFIESNGRTYKSWDDFTGNNILPSCIYMAPRTGIYAGDGIFSIFKTPEIRLYSRTADVISSIVSVGAVVAGVFSIAPLTVGAVAVGTSVYGVARSTHMLYDRSQHFESIGLDNYESVMNYGNIAVSTLTGLSSVAVRNYASLTARYGVWVGRSITSLNYSLLIFDAGFLGLNIYNSVQAYNNNTLSATDVFNLSLQILIFYGAVSNVREMHEFLNKSDTQKSVNVTNKKLTKTQKRNLQRRIAKALKREQQGIVTDTVKVSDTNNETSFRLWALGSAIGITLLLRVYPRAEIILRELFEIRNIFISFIRKSITLEDFFFKIIDHFNNLYEIIKNDLEHISSYFKNYFRRTPVSDNIVYLTSDRVDTIQQSIQDNMNEIDDDTAQGTVYEIQNDEETYSEQQTNEEYEVPLYEKILHSVRYIVKSCQIKQTTVAVICVYHETVLFVTEALLQYKSKYDTLYDKNANIVGEEKAKLMLKALGTKTSNDYILNKDVLDEEILKIKDRIFEFCKNNSNIVDGTKTVSPLSDEVIIRCENTIKDLFTCLFGEPKEVGLIITNEIIRKISSILFEELILEVEDMKKQIENLYKTNVEIIGEKSIQRMLKVIDIYTDELEMFTYLMNKKRDYFSEKIKNECIQLLVRLNSNSLNYNHENLDVESENNSTNDRSSDIFNFISICNNVFHKIDGYAIEEETERNEVFKKIIDFVAFKFINKIRDGETILKKLKFNVDITGKKLFKKMLDNIDMFKDEHSFLLKDLADQLDNNILVQEYFEYSDTNKSDLNHIKLWENTIADEGFMMYVMNNSTSNHPDSFYRDSASNLFKIRFDFDIVVKRNENFVMLTTEENVVIFNFIGDNKAIVIKLENRDRLEDFIVI